MLRNLLKNSKPFPRNSDKIKNMTTLTLKWCRLIIRFCNVCEDVLYKHPFEALLQNFCLSKAIVVKSICLNLIDRAKENIQEDISFNRHVKHCE